MTHIIEDAMLPARRKAEAARTTSRRLLNLEEASVLSLPNQVWQLSALLQTTLDIEKIIALFARELGRQVKHDSFAYRYAGQDMTIQQGDAARHSASFRLLLEERLLGEITITRASRFSETEIRAAETLISGLLFALRNAILYREALDSAHKDPLTGAANRAALEAVLKREIGLYRRHKLPLSVLMIDLDKFKRINDTYGHATGDKVLQSLVQSVTESTRNTDVLARYGGEEFVVVLPGTDSSGAELLAKRILRRLDGQAVAVQGKGQEEIYFTASIGVASIRSKDTISTLVDRADQAMYAAKQDGGGRVRVG